MGFLDFGYDDSVAKAQEYYQQGAQQAQEELQRQQQAGTQAIQTGVTTAGQTTQPYQQAGTQALGTYTGSLGLGTPQQQQQAYDAFKASPGYQWAVDQATQGIQKSLAARGLGASGAEQRELGRYLTGAASQEFGSWQDRLAQLTGIGQASAEEQAGRQYGAGTTEAGLGLQYALPSAQIYQDVGQAMAESELSKALMKQQNLSSLIGGISNIAGLGLGSIVPYLGGGSSTSTGGRSAMTLSQIAPYM